MGYPVGRPYPKGTRRPNRLSAGRGGARPEGLYSLPFGRGRKNYVVWWYKGGGRCHKVGLEHRILMEQRLGRAMTDREEVHHLNGIGTDNRPENLELRVGNHGNGATHCYHCGQYLTPPYAQAAS